MPKKYYSGDAELTFSQKVTEQDVAKGKVSPKDIENICSDNLVNKIYYEMATDGKRDQALTMAAEVIVDHGCALKEELDRNDEGAKEDSVDMGADIADTESAKTPQKEATQTEKNTTPDISRVSGGTIATVIQKIVAILSSMSGDDKTNVISNFSAMIEVLNSPMLRQKFEEVVKALSKDPVLVADIKDLLVNEKGGRAFKEVAGNIGNDVSAVELENRRQENKKAHGSENSREG